MLCAKIDWNWPIGSGGTDFKISSILYIFTTSNLSPHGKERGSSFEQTWTPFTKGCFVPSSVIICPVVLKKKILKFRQLIFAIYLLSPLGKEHGPSFEQIWVPFTERCFELSLVEIGSSVVLQKNFLIVSMYFHYFVIISPWKKAGPFIWTNLNPLHPGILCAKFGWNWPTGSGEDENVKSLWQWRRRQRRRPTDKFWSEKLTWAFGSG